MLDLRVETTTVHIDPPKGGSRFVAAMSNLTPSAQANRIAAMD